MQCLVFLSLYNIEYNKGLFIFVYCIHKKSLRNGVITNLVKM